MSNLNNDQFMAFLRRKLLDTVDDRRYEFTDSPQITITPSVIETFENNKDFLIDTIWRENECTGEINTTTHCFFGSYTRFELVLSFEHEGTVVSDEYISTYTLNSINITNFELKEVYEHRVQN